MSNEAEGERDKGLWSPKGVLAAALAAAAAVLLMIWMGEPEPATYLTLEEVELIAPLGEVPAEVGYGIFRWAYDLPKDCQLRVIVRDDGTFIMQSPLLRASRWDPGDTRDWPGQINWCLELHDSSGASPRRLAEGARAGRR